MGNIPKTEMGNKTLSAQLDEDSDLAKQFEQYRERKGMKSKSEAVRTLVRKSLERDQQEQKSDAVPDKTSDSTSSDSMSSESGTVIERLRSFTPGDSLLVWTGLIIAIPYLLGGGALLQALQITLGSAAGSRVFVYLGIGILLLLIPLMIAFIVELIRDLRQMWLQLRSSEEPNADESPAGVEA